MLEDQERFGEIIGEIGELVEEAMGLLSDSGDYPMLVERARSYWYAHIRTALSDENEFVGRSMCNMEDTLEEWRELDGSDGSRSGGPYRCGSYPQFNTQSDWDAYVANNGINEYEEEDEEGSV